MTQQQEKIIATWNGQTLNSEELWELKCSMNYELFWSHAPNVIIAYYNGMPVIRRISVAEYAKVEQLQIEDAIDSIRECLNINQPSKSFFCSLLKWYRKLNISFE